MRAGRAWTRTRPRGSSSHSESASSRSKTSSGASLDPRQPPVQVDVDGPAEPDLAMVVVVDEAKSLGPQCSLRRRQLAIADKQVDVVVDALAGGVVEPASNRGAFEEQRRDAGRLERGADLDRNRIEGGHRADHRGFRPGGFHQYWLSVPALRVWSTARRKR